MLAQRTPKLSARRLYRFGIVTTVVAALLLLLISGWFIYREIAADIAPPTLSESMGIQGSIPSLRNDQEKQQGIDKIAEAGFGWMRHEIVNETPVNYPNYDTVTRMAKAKGIKILAVLAWGGPQKSHDDWKNYVREAVTHFGSDVAAWEIMNEIDEVIPAAEYVVYLREANEIIRSVNPNATIVLSGLTSRPKVVSWWDGIAAAGGWGLFDVIGIHYYHDANPERVRFGGGDALSYYTRPLASINKHGAKKIWVTETGYIDVAGRENQANWLARSLIIAKSVPQIEKVFIYQLYNNGDQHPYGLLDSNLAEYPAYQTVKDTVRQLQAVGATQPISQVKRTELDDFVGLEGWKIAQTDAGSAEIAEAEGPAGRAMQVTYKFDLPTSFTILQKRIPLGQPQSLSARFYGDDADNVWKFRFTDSQNETFQADLGPIPSGWSYKQFTFGVDTAVVSWGGDNKIDYPITFDSIVVDRQGGRPSGSGRIAELSRVDANAELVAYQVGGRVAYWRTAESASAEICGQPIQATERPQYLVSTGCAEVPKIAFERKAAPSPSPLPTVEPVKKKSPVTPPPVAAIDYTKTAVEIKGENVRADTISNYRVTIALKDTNNRPVTTTVPEIILNTGQKTTLIEGPVLANDIWEAKVSSSRPGSVVAMVKAADQTVKDNIALEFSPVMVAKAVTKPPTLFGLYGRYLALGFWSLVGVLALLILTYVAYYHRTGHVMPLADLGPTSYVNLMRRLGYPDSQIAANLRHAGWSQEHIKRAILSDK